MVQGWQVIRLLIADYSLPVLRGIRALLEPVEDIRIVGEAKDLDEAFRFTEALRPDVLLIDLTLRGTESRLFDLRNLAATCACSVVTMAFSADSGAHKIAASVGAMRLLDKVNLYDTLIPTLREVVNRR